MPLPLPSPLAALVLAAAVGAGCASGGEGPQGDDDSDSPPRGAFAVHFFDVGTSDATLVVSPTGETLLVDLGVPQVVVERVEASAEEVVRRIEEITGERRVDAFLLTHFHSDHAGTIEGGVPTGGLPYAVDVLGLEVGAFLDRGSVPVSDSGTQARHLSWLLGREHVVVDGPGSHWIDLGPEVRADVLAAAGGSGLQGEEGEIEENNYSLAVRITYGDLEISLCGDLPGDYTARDHALDYQDVETGLAPLMGTVEVLKPNHHGSQSSSNVTWLQALSPQVAVFALGPNEYGYPHEVTWDRVVAATAARGGRVYRTRDDAFVPVDGEVVVLSDDGVAYTVNGDAYEAVPDEAEAGLAPVLPGVSDESTDAACSDGRDGDGDCYCDCDDWSCALSPAVTVCDGPAASYCGYAQGPWCDGVREGID